MHLVNEDSGRYVHHVEISLETELVSDFTIDVSLFWDRVDAPVAFEDGTISSRYAIII